MIFNHNSAGSEEMKSVIGFIQASIAFENIEPFVRFAENDLKKIIGKEVFELAERHYKSENYEVPDTEGSGSGSGMEPGYEILTELVKKIQIPVAFHAYMMFAASNDLTHSDKGRQIFVSETEKPAFEWMIARDEENILSLAYKSTDELLDFLMENASFFPEWTSSQAYKESLSLFVNRAEDFDRIFPIDKSRRLFILMMPFIRENERKYIRPVIGTETFNDLKEAIEKQSPEEDQTELLEYISVPLVLLTIATAVTRLPLKIFPSGIMQQYVETPNDLVGKKPAERDVRNGFYREIMNQAREELKVLQEYLLKKAAEDAGETYTPADQSARHSSSNNFFRA